jgi:hypothetical protein
MNDELTIPDDDSGLSPSAVGRDTSDGPRIVYPSAAKAFRAGAWRGAKFGGKWTALILGSLLFVVNLAMLAMLLYCMYRWPTDQPPLTFLDVLKLVGVCILVLVHTTLVTAAVSAIIMGIGEGISYWQSGRKARIPTVS